MTRDNFFVSRSDEVVELLKELNRPNVKLLFDFYHIQISEGDLTRRLDRHWPYIGHFQFAACRHGTNGRHRDQPETAGRRNRAARLAGYLGAEYRASGPHGRRAGMAEDIGSAGNFVTPRAAPGLHRKRIPGCCLCHMRPDQSSCRRRGDGAVAKDRRRNSAKSGCRRLSGPLPGRRQALARYILDNTGTVRGKRVLDFASGSGLVAIAAAKAARPRSRRARSIFSPLRPSG